MSFTIKNDTTGKVYYEAATLTDARNFCGQRLLRLAADRQGFLSNLAAGLITVYEAHSLSRGYSGPGF